jgi:hypothetical protein
VEKAVVEMTNLVQSLHQVEESAPPQTSHPAVQSPPANVYQLFDSTLERQLAERSEPRVRAEARCEDRDFALNLEFMEI